VVRPGMLTTVQDTGRTGWRRHGVVAGGAVDAFALRCANVLVGNEEHAAGLECTIIGPELSFEDERVIAVAGFAPRAQLDGAEIPPFTAVRASAGSTLVLADTGQGVRAYVAISGGIAVGMVLGSRATDLTARLGGFHGRSLEYADVLPLGPPDVFTAIGGRAVAGRSMLPAYSTEPVVRVLPGPEAERLGSVVLTRFLRERYTVTPESNRMGCRLNGDALQPGNPIEMISSPVAPGTVQLPPSGQPIVLLADAQTIGGYPRLAGVISFDLPLLAQLRPGHGVEFVVTDVREAERLAAERRRDLRLLRDALRLRS
jgi:antagonist of KipI